jgi:hypothetical protein
MATMAEVIIEIVDVIGKTQDVPQEAMEQSTEFFFGRKKQLVLTVLAFRKLMEMPPDDTPKK